MGVFSKFWITLSPDDTGMYVGWEVWHLLRQGWVRPNNCGSQGLRILESNSRPRKDLDLSHLLNFASLFNLGKFGADWFFRDEWSKLPEACFSLLLCLTFKLKPMLEVNKARRAKSLIRLGGRNTRVGNILKSNPSCLFLLYILFILLFIFSIFTLSKQIVQVINVTNIIFIHHTSISPQLQTLITCYVWSSVLSSFSYHKCKFPQEHERRYKMWGGIHLQLFFCALKHRVFIILLC